MGTRKQMQTVYIDASSGLDVSLPDGTQVFTKDTAQLWVLNNGSYALMTSGATSNPEGWTTIVKSANQDVTNATYQNDNDFYFSVDAGGTYMINCEFVGSSNEANQLAGQIIVDSGSFSGRGQYTISAINSLSTAGAASLAVAITTTTNIDNTTYCSINYTFTVSSTTTFRWKFGNTAAAGGRTSRMWKGSIMKYKKLN
jgi:hypothetical protein